MKKFYDYEPTGDCCEFYQTIDDVCHEPTIYRVTLYDENNTWLDTILLCEKHFHKVIEGLEKLV